MMCEQLGKEPDPDKMPLDASSFPYEVHVAFFVFSLLPDRWDGMSGYYLGKDWSSCQFLCDVYDIEDRKEVIYIAKVYEGIIVKDKAEETNRKQKAAERKAKSGTGSP
tara:strand:+ start:1585 stop:1908 length:324 start_codon:yes stop_codon:yes gene_type:complete